MNIAIINNLKTNNVITKYFECKRQLNKDLIDLSNKLTHFIAVIFEQRKSDNDYILLSKHDIKNYVLRCNFNQDYNKALAIAITKLIQEKFIIVKCSAGLFIKKGDK